ncbi:restriction endonuclease subunit S [Clostridium butyricum]|uniref:restriction endonuclease subunit S n=1 Tax=Clostridium butyricum TaxID=1492 RepID=UPI003D32EA1F
MVEEKKIPDGYKMSEVGIIPTEWSIQEIKEIAPLQRGFDLSKRFICDNGNYPVVYSNGVGAYHTKFKVKGPGVVTGRSGTLGKVFYIEQDYWPHNTTLWVTNFHNNNPRYIYYVYLNMKLNNFGTGSGVPTLNRNDILSKKIAIPTLKEQELIAKFLSDTDNLILSIEKLIDKKNLIKQGTMQDLLTGKKRIEGFEGEWTQRCMSDLGCTYSGLSGKKKSDFENGNSLYIPFMNIISNPIINTDFLEPVFVKESEIQNKVKRGDLFFNTSSETPEEVGMCSVILQDIESLFLNSFCFGFRINNLNDVNPIFISYFFRSKFGRNMMSYLAQGSTRYNLSKSSFIKLTLMLPTYEEQEAIAKILIDMDKEIEALQKKLDKYKKIKEGMMEELLTGKRRLI